MALDLASLASVRSFATAFLSSEPRLDILIHNAGEGRAGGLQGVGGWPGAAIPSSQVLRGASGHVGRVPPTSISQMEKHGPVGLPLEQYSYLACPPASGISSCGRTREPFNLLLRVNHVSPFLLTHLLLPRLKTCTPSRVVVVSSAAHRRGRLDFKRLDRPVVGWQQELRAYADSKLANVLFVRELANQFEGTGITCYAAHPGETWLALTAWLGFVSSHLPIPILSPLTSHNSSRKATWFKERSISWLILDSYFEGGLLRDTGAY